MYCTPGRSKKVVVALVVVPLTVATVLGIMGRFSDIRGIYSIASNVSIVVFFVTLPVTILVINVTVVCAVRRASNNAAANLGQQSTSSSSAVPTVMLVTTSLVYVLLCGMMVFAHFAISSPMFRTQALFITDTSQHLVYAYNFYVYLITGKQFRLELRKLFHCCTPPHHAAAAADRADDEAVRQPPRGQADTRVYNISGKTIYGQISTTFFFKRCSFRTFFSVHFFRELSALYMISAKCVELE